MTLHFSPPKARSGAGSAKVRAGTGLHQTLLIGATILLAPLIAGQGAEPAQSEPVVSVVACGAVPNDGGDDSEAFARAFARAAQSGRGVVYIPAGDYVFKRRVAVDLKGVGLTVRGDGQGVSRLFGHNSEGILALRDDSCTWQVAVRDLSFFAALPDSGVALEVTSAGRGARHYRSLVVRDVDIRSGPTLPATNYFTAAFKAIGQWRPLFENAIACGAAGPKISYLKGDDDVVYRMAVGFQADWCYAPSFEHCYAWSAHTGYRIVSEGRPEGPEDGSFRRCTANSVRIGIDIKTPIKEPQLVIDSCHVNARDVGIRLEKSEHSPFAWPPRGKPLGIMAKRPLRGSGSWNRRTERGKPRGMDPPAIQTAHRADPAGIPQGAPPLRGFLNRKRQFRNG